MNQLARVDSESHNETVTYKYDKSGNIILKERYTCNDVDDDLFEKTLVESITYTYGDSNWKEKLTAYNGKTITYDAIGNPLTYDGQTFTWLGRRMMSYKSGSTTTSYQYNRDGIRTTKTVGSTTTKYFLDGSTILAQQTGNTTIPFYYDANGKRIAFKYNGEMYYYVYNLQGDVTHIMKGDKTIVGTYQYDAWGKILNLNSLTAIAKVNPFRYRGYYYDTESNLYYLNSRYYNPEWGRFINADNVSDGKAGVLGYNLFIYAADNPLNNSDLNGHWIIKNAIKWISKNIRPTIKKIKKSLSKQNVTCSKGFNISGTPSAFSFNLQGGVSIDTKGNVAFQGAFSGGAIGGSPALSATVYNSISNAKNIDKLNGPGYQIGGSVCVPVYGVPVAVGGDFNIIPDENENTNYYGITSNVGFGIPGGEFHVEWGETKTLGGVQFNVFDVADKVYIKIMEW